MTQERGASSQQHNSGTLLGGSVPWSAGKTRRDLISKALENHWFLSNFLDFFCLLPVSILVPTGLCEIFQISFAKIPWSLLCSLDPFHAIMQTIRTDKFLWVQLSRRKCRWSTTCRSHLSWLSLLGRLPHAVGPVGFSTPVMRQWNCLFNTDSLSFCKRTPDCSDDPDLHTQFFLR